MRDQGFYWISRKGDDAEVAKWDGRYWWLVGDECERDDDDVKCLSGRIRQPDNG
jgi:hypothetical protein